MITHEDLNSSAAQDEPAENSREIWSTLELNIVCLVASPLHRGLCKLLVQIPLDSYSPLPIALQLRIIEIERSLKPCTAIVEQTCSGFFGSRRVSWQVGKKPDWLPPLRAIAFLTCSKSKKFAICVPQRFALR